MKSSSFVAQKTLPETIFFFFPWPSSPIARVVQRVVGEVGSVSHTEARDVTPEGLRPTAELILKKLKLKMTK